LRTTSTAACNPSRAAIRGRLPPVRRYGRLANGVRLLAVRNDETPTIALQVVFAMGQRDEPEGKAGLASLTSGD
jgi:predicted Zn-dependent peptidase